MPTWRRIRLTCRFDLERILNPNENADGLIAQWPQLEKPGCIYVIVAVEGFGGVQVTRHLDAYAALHEYARWSAKVRHRQAYGVAFCQSGHGFEDHMNYVHMSPNPQEASHFFNTMLRQIRPYVPPEIMTHPYLQKVAE